MLVVIVYDVAMKVGNGNIRRNHIAKICGRIGTAVQGSVYECEINEDQYRHAKKELQTAIVEEDSVRFYKLGNQYQSKVETIGQKKEKWEIGEYVI